MARIEPAEYTPDTAVPPGFMVSDLLQDLELSVAEFADRADLTEDQGFDLINGNYPIGPELAAFLAEFFGIPTHVWENLERNYRRTVDRLDAQASRRENVDFTRWFPLKDMIRFGWIEDLKDPDARAAQLLDFLGIGSWQQFPASPVYSTMFRKSPSHAFSEHAMVAWLARGRQEAAKIEVTAFDPVALRALLPELRALTLATPDEFARKIVSICAGCGVAVVYVPAPRRCTASGAAYRVEGKHIVQLSLRYKRNDHFWFTLFHELAHVILHSSGDFVDYLDPVAGPLEDEADQFASDILLPREAYNAWRTRTHPTREAVLAFADQIGIAPGIVVGRLMRDRLLGYERLPDLFQPLEFVN